ncbi:hypothetical protein NC652_023232 [Populus alba x Populus x berolinensis]|nr:hypothetical protein NC652_023232 [Populus alba x Populus x berolinensis]
MARHTLRVGNADLEKGKVLLIALFDLADEILLMAKGDCKPESVETRHATVDIVLLLLIVCACLYSWKGMTALLKSGYGCKHLHAMVSLIGQQHLPASSRYLHSLRNNQVIEVILT